MVVSDKFYGVDLTIVFPSLQNFQLKDNHLLPSAINASLFTLQIKKNIRCCELI
jgi:hypothetical protein